MRRLSICLRAMSQLSPHLRDRSLGALAVREPGGVLQPAIDEILEVLKEVVVEGRGLVRKVFGEMVNAEQLENLAHA